MKQHKKPFGIYHWDTFDNETFLVDEADTLKEAEEKVEDTYGKKLNNLGADRVDIVDLKGNIVRQFTTC